MAPSLTHHGIENPNKEKYEEAIKFIKDITNEVKMNDDIDEDSYEDNYEDNHKATWDLALKILGASNTTRRFYEQQLKRLIDKIKALRKRLHKIENGKKR